MDSLTLTLIIAYSILPIFVIISIYNAVSWNWKTKPIRPLLIGLVMLVVAFVGQSYSASEFVNTKIILDKPGITLPQDAVHVLTAVGRANEFLTKLIELVTIPLAVSLIAAALIAKADINFQARIKRYQKKCEKLADLEAKVEIAEQEFERCLDVKARGKILLDAREKLSYLRTQAREHRWKIFDEFQPLIDTDFVEPPNRF
ncbi:hypothetical protein ACIPF8_09995 [Collimonas sp. NPDC087041]|uniref:hypothetical protein n=1 Tax=Collimonas sp. NPDC087041 TaxID=3363960 RepID=UPI003817DE3C